MTMTDTQKFNAMKMILDALLETVRDAGEHGAPGGPMYLAMMQHVPSITADQFNSVMSILVQAKKVTKRGQLYFAVEARHNAEVPCQRATQE